MKNGSVLIKIFAVALSLVLVLGTIGGCTKKPGDRSETDIPVFSSTPTEAVTSASAQPETDLPSSEAPDSNTPEGNNTPEPTTLNPDDSSAPATPNASDTEIPTSPATDVPATPAPATAVPATPVPTSGSDTVSIGTASKPARFTMPTDLYGLSEATCEAWFGDAVFIGDSLTIGWKNYNNKMLENNPSFFGCTHFLCEGSYGVGHAFDPISETSLHPIYGGEQHYLWDSVAMMGANKVFILFGLNDLSIYGVDGTADRFDELTDNIAASRPGVQIYIISAMYMYRGSEREKLNNRNLYLLNQRLVEMCNRKGYQFINIASHLIDESGFVPEQYSSDHYVHQTYAAYAVWAEILRSTAAREIKNLPPVVFSLPN